MDATILLAGVSRPHDVLVAAVLQRLGRIVVTTAIPGTTELARGRALLPRGYPASTAGLAGALVCALDRMPAPVGSAPPTYVVYATDGTGIASDYRLALSRAGRGEVEVVVLGPEMDDWVRAIEALDKGAETGLARSMLDAIVTADVFALRASEARSSRRNEQRLDHVLDAALMELSSYFLRRRDPGPILAELDRTLASPRSDGPTRLRVAVAGDPFCVTTDGLLGGGVRRWLQMRGARVSPVLACSWVTELAFRAGADRAVRFVRCLFQRRARQIGLGRRVLADPCSTAALVRRSAGPHTHLPVAAHLLVGAYLEAARDETADLVVALDPFVCTASTAIATAHLHNLARTHRPGFVALELSGDTEVQIESRLDLALDLARAAGCSP